VCMAHPPTFLNKVIIGGADGSIQLRNFNSDTLLYTFKLNSRICCLEGSPALDVVGIGLADGSAVLLNLKYDEEVMRFHNAAGAGTISSSASVGNSANGSARAVAPCTCLSFRCALTIPVATPLLPSALRPRLGQLKLGSAVGVCLQLCTKAGLSVSTCSALLAASWACLQAVSPSCPA
jgi:hypothetical protein